MPKASDGTEPQPESAYHVHCSRCGGDVDLTKPLPAQGWQTVHVCPGQVIQALALGAGETAWAWYASQPGEAG